MASDRSGASTLVMLTDDGMGRGDDDLRRKLLRTWLTLVLENGDPPGAIAFYTQGVRLVVEGSPVLDLLGRLEAKGVRLIACTTCLAHYGLQGGLRVGIAGGMGDILAAQWTAGKVITL